MPLLDWNCRSSSIMISFQALEPEGKMSQVQLCSVLGQMREKNRGVWLTSYFGRRSVCFGCPNGQHWLSSSSALPSFTIIFHNQLSIHFASSIALLFLSNSPEIFISKLFFLYDTIHSQLFDLNLAPTSTLLAPELVHLS